MNDNSYVRIRTSLGGAVTVARMLRDFGMEVIYLGNAYPDGIIQATIQEVVDVVGVSSLTGSHLTLGSDLLRIAKRSGTVDEVVFVIGGVFPSDDMIALKKVGFDGVFGPGARGEEIYDFIRNAVTAKTKRA